MNRNILIVDDERSVRIFLRELFEQENYLVFEAENGKNALYALKQNVMDVVVLDLGLPDTSGLDLIPEIKTINSTVEIIVITAMGTVDNAVNSMRFGAYDFITKPFDVEKILISVKRALNFVIVNKENRVLKKLQKNGIYFQEFIGESLEVKKLKGLISKLQHVDVPILITGETGTGKNILAKQIYFTFADVDIPIVYINCCSIPDPLFESEFFGHEKGSFTGAAALKKGRVEDADNGTLILDEISEIPYELQAKLLDFIQEKSFYRVGGNQRISVNTRIIALSNRDLQEEIREGRFRKDLFYRLNIVHMHIPPLKDRGSDIILLADYFMGVLKKKYGKDKKLSTLCCKTLQSYSWPGNVRELKNTLERVFIFSENDIIDENDLSFETDELRIEGKNLKSLLANLEKKIIIETLAGNNGNRTRTAIDLNVSLRNLQYKLNKYDLID